jgi:hypothetical protein
MFLSNLWFLLTKAPQIIGIIKMIIDIIGSPQVQSLLESILSALKKEVPTPDKMPKTEPERIRLLERLRRRLALSNLGMSDGDYVAFCDRKQERNQA